MKKSQNTKSSMKIDQSKKGTSSLKTPAKTAGGLLMKAKNLVKNLTHKKSEVKMPSGKLPSHQKKQPAVAMAPKSAAKRPMTKGKPVPPTKLHNNASVKAAPTKPAAPVKLANGKVPPTRPAPSAPVKALTKEVHKLGKPAPTTHASLKGPSEQDRNLQKSNKAKTAAAKQAGSYADSNFEKMCRESSCENLATTKGYCRLDYIKNWKKIKRKEMILKEGKLNQYIEELVSKYPDKYIDVIRQDLSTEVNFNKVIHDLELDESIDDLDYDGDSIDSLIGSIKKEGEGFDDTDF